MRLRWLFALALLVRLAASALVTGPGYIDAAYYYHVATSLAQGEGLTQHIIWNYLYLPQTLTHPSNAYWMPLVSLLMWPFMAVFGTSFRAAQAPLVLLSALLPVCTYLIARSLIGRAKATAAALLVLFVPSYFRYFATTDMMAPFALAAVAALWGTTAAWRRGPRWFVLVGVATGLAFLARSDGALLLVVAIGVIAFSHSRWRSGIEPSEAAPPIPWSSLLWLGAGFALVAGPWLARNQAAFGAPLAGGGLGLVFLRDYNDIFSYGATWSLSSYLSLGPAGIIFPKVAALGEVLSSAALALAVYLAPFAALGFWRLRRRAELLAFWLYAVLLVVAMSFVFTFPGPRGSFAHAQAALLPVYYVCAVEGLWAAIEWVSRRRAGWNAARASRNISVIFIVANACACLVVMLAPSSEEAARYEAYSAAEVWLSANGSTAPVMVADPASYYYVSGREAVVTPNNDIETASAVARRYGVRYLILEPAHPPAWHQLYLGREASPRLRLLTTLPWEQQTTALETLRAPGDDAVVTAVLYEFVEP